MQEDGLDCFNATAPVEQYPWAVDHIAFHRKIQKTAT